MAKWLQLFDAADAPFLPGESAELRTVMAQRARLACDDYGTQARLADAMMFTEYARTHAPATRGRHTCTHVQPRGTGTCHAHAMGRAHSSMPTWQTR